MKKIYLFLANGFEEIEAITIIDVLRRANILAVTCSITSEKEVVGAHGITIIADLLFNESNFEDADMLVLPGGMPGTSNLNDYIPLIELLKKHAGKKKALAAICAAPLVLGGLGILHGKRRPAMPVTKIFLPARYFLINPSNKVAISSQPMVRQLPSSLR